MSDERKKISDLFRRMADDIDRNVDAGFGGAFVVVPPSSGGEPFENLVIGSQDPADFYILLKSKAEAQIRAIDVLARQGQIRR